MCTRSDALQSVPIPHSRRTEHSSGKCSASDRASGPIFISTSIQNIVLCVLLFKDTSSDPEKAPSLGI